MIIKHCFERRDLQFANTQSPMQSSDIPIDVDESFFSLGVVVQSIVIAIDEIYVLYALHLKRDASYFRSVSQGR